MILSLINVGERSSCDLVLTLLVVSDPFICASAAYGV
jgi:hypothetical protein